MSTYTISDIHGCYDEFMALLELIKFNPNLDILYIIGDVIDRGNRPIDCLRYIIHTPNVIMLMGNHEQTFLNLYGNLTKEALNGVCYPTMSQLIKLPETERDNIIAYLRERPYYHTIDLNSKNYFLSHAGLDVNKQLTNQSENTLVCGRIDFYGYKAIQDYICIFGHTPASFLRSNYDCSIWFDEEFKDKICIDSGCTYGGALSALRLDDGETFYVKSQQGNNEKYTFSTYPSPLNFIKYSNLEITANKKE